MTPISSHCKQLPLEGEDDVLAKVLVVSPMCQALFSALGGNERFPPLAPCKQWDKL